MAFQKQQTIRFLYAPNLSIVRKAGFEKCENLCQIIGTKLSILENRAFSNCFNLRKINLENVVTFERRSIHYCALQEIKNKKCELLVKESIEDCADLECLDFQQLKELNPEQIEHCDDIKYCNLPNIEKCTTDILKNCFITNGSSEIVKENHKLIDKLPEIIDIFEPDKKHLQQLSTNDEFYIGQILYNKQLRLGDKYTNISGLVSIHTVEIPQEAFVAHKLKFAYLPQVTIIKQSAFSNCSRLRKMYSKSLKEIEECGLEGCCSLSQIDVDKVEKLGFRSFFFCDQLVNLKFSDALKELPDVSLEFCNNLMQVVGYGIQQIHEECFSKPVNVVTKAMPQGDFELYRVGKEIKFQEALIDEFVERKELKMQLQNRKSITLQIKKQMEALKRINK